MREKRYDSRMVRANRAWRTWLGIAAAGLGLSACAPDPTARGEPGSEEPTEAARFQEFTVVTVAEGLEHPWGMAFLPDGDILVTERPGRLRRVRDGDLLPEPIPGVPQVWAQGQGGLLDIALHPAFASNALLYLSYSKPGPQGATTAVARGRYEEGRLSEVEDIFVADAWSGAGQHFGSRLLFDQAGFLYVTIGDRGAMERAQDTSDHVGTTVRLHDDGQVPDDNPFVGQAGRRPEIYTFGNRNAQGMALDPQTGEVWQNEHGPRGGDELNAIRAGANYGWPQVSFGDHYDGRPIPDPSPGDGTALPIVHWTPAIAPSGLAFYTGDVFPQWRGDALLGSLVGRHLRRVVLDGTQVIEQESLLGDLGHRIRDVREGPDGRIYLLVDDSQAPLLRLEPAGGS